MKKKTRAARRAAPNSGRAARPTVRPKRANARLAARIERLESIEEIRMLAAKYSLSLDMRDLDAHVNLFAPDIRVGHDRIGRGHLKTWVDATLRNQFTGTAHHLGGHIIEFTDRLACPRRGLFQERARDRHGVGDHADALLG